MDIYEDIYQSVISPHRSKLNLSFSRRNKREYPIRELVETEEKYLGRYRYTKKKTKIVSGVVFLQTPCYTVIFLQIFG